MPICRGFQVELEVSGSDLPSEDNLKLLVWLTHGKSACENVCVGYHVFSNVHK